MASGSPLGVCSVACRSVWEQAGDSMSKLRLVDYNAADCQATELIGKALGALTKTTPSTTGTPGPEAHAVRVELLRPEERRIGKFVSEFKELEQINLKAWWDYQRDRIYVKSGQLKRANAPSSKRKAWKSRIQPNKTVVVPEVKSCPKCGQPSRALSRSTRVVYNLRFGKASIKRWVIKFVFQNLWCSQCKKRFGEPSEMWAARSHWGRDLVAYILAQTLDMGVPLLTVRKQLGRFFQLELHFASLIQMKRDAAQRYQKVYETIFNVVRSGNLLHADETQVSIRGKTGYVWVFTNLHSVAYMYADSREGGFLTEFLKDFKGVLVSDFFTVYDSVKCEQQKCLVHLMRDLNDEVLKHPFDEELKKIVRDFATLLKPIIETISARGLKSRFLRKHRKDVGGFYRNLLNGPALNEPAVKCRQRFIKNRERLFTFLNHDGVPWNNNNAEHAIRAVAKLRDVVRGSFTERSIRDVLVLLSICETCRYSGVDFLDFLRSGEMDIYSFATSHRRQRRPTIPPAPEATAVDRMMGVNAN